MEQPVAALAHQVGTLVVDEHVEQRSGVLRQLEPQRAFGDDLHLQVHRG
jgi:hypothetical protein